MLLNTQTGTYYLEPENIIRIQALSNYSKIFMIDQKPLIVAKVLRFFEENVCEQGFIRINKSHIINKKYIKNVNKEKQLAITLANDEIFTVSRRKGSIVKEKIA